MRAYLLRRAGISLITLVIASIVVFLGVRAVPGSPATALSGNANLSPAALVAVNREYGLENPLPVQYIDWVGQLVRINLGSSPVTGMPVSTEIGNALPITLELTILSMLVALLLGIPTGIVAALRRGKTADYVSNGLALFGLSIPSFWFGIMLILLLSVHFSVLPSSGFVSFSTDPGENLLHMVMPAFVLGTGVAAVLMRQTRSGMLETLRSDYVRTARAKGLAERVVIYRHALRNSLLPVVTVLGFRFAYLLSGAVVVEQVFSIPGMGRFILERINARDFPAVQSTTLVLALFIVLANYATDLCYAWIDPRVRYR